MKFVFYLLISCLLSSFVFSCQPKENNQTIYLEADTVSLLRNPCMGWGLYDDASGEVQNADEYWQAQNEAACKYGSFFLCSLALV